MSRSLWRQLGMSAAVVALVASSCTTSSNSSGTPVKGGVVTYGNDQHPKWIFPFLDPGHASSLNTRGFQYLMYRPLYWFGGPNGEATINFDLSIAQRPAFSDNNQTVVVRLKNWKWSDGTTLSPRNVAFWMGLDYTEKNKLLFYSPGSIPDDLASIAYDDAANTVTFHLTAPVAPDFFLSDELLQIIPLPLAWDVTTAGQPGQCSSEVLNQQLASCPAVYNYLVGLAKNTSDYAASTGASAIWQIVDGPWRLSSFNPDGHVSFVPNGSYSGPNKPHISRLDYLPFTDLSSMENVLRSNSSLTIGSLPSDDLPKKPVDQALGPNPLAPRYTLRAPEPFWGVSFWFINFNNPTVGPLFKQLYIRQALQSVIDQKTDVAVAYRGYGGPTNSPIPTSYPGFGHPPELYPFSVAKARQYLTTNGWTIPASGPATCTNPGTGNGQCGAGIRQGASAEFVFENYSGYPTNDEIVQQFRSDASRAGIVLDIKQVSIDQMVGDAVQCKPTDPGCGWQIINWGAETYAGGLPIETGLFLSNGSVDIGSYSDSTLDGLINDVIHSSDPNALSKYASYVSQQLPVLFQPIQVASIYAVATNLHGANVAGLPDSFTPEDWFFAS